MNASDIIPELYKRICILIKKRHTAFCYTRFTFLLGNGKFIRFSFNVLHLMSLAGSVARRLFHWQYDAADRCTCRSFAMIKWNHWLWWIEWNSVNRIQSWRSLSLVLAILKNSYTSTYWHVDIGFSIPWHLKIGSCIPNDTSIRFDSLAN